MTKLFWRKPLTVTLAFVMALALPLCGMFSLLAAAEDNEIIYQEDDGGGDAVYDDIVFADDPADDEAEENSEPEEADEADEDNGDDEPAIMAYVEIEDDVDEPDGDNDAMYLGEADGGDDDVATPGNTESADEQAEEPEQEEIEEAEPEQNTEDAQIITIAAFGSLADEILYQGFDLPKEDEAPLTLDDINFPMTLEATDIDGGAITVALDYWLSDDYDLAAPGMYTFTAKLPDGYALGDGATMPEIIVIVRPADLAIAPMAANISVGTLEELQTAITNAGTEETTIMLTATIEASGDVNLNGTDKNITITRASLFTKDMFEAFTPGTSLTFENITIDGGESSSQGAVLVYVQSNFIMKDGATLQNNNTGAGAAVYVASGGTFTMNGGKITGNTSTGNGGGVYVNGGTFTMNGGTISRNTATIGGGVHHESGIFNMTDGEISNNTAGNGAGASIYGGTFTMTGGKIIGNASTGNYGGVEYYQGTVKLGGTAIISGNTLKGNVNNLHLETSGKYITLLTGADAPNGMYVGVTLESGTGTIVSSGASEVMQYYFFADDSAKKVTYSSGVLSVGAGTNPTALEAFKAQIDVFNSGDSDMTINVTEDITLDALQTISNASGKTLTITGGGTITRGSGVTGNLFTVNSGANLILQNITIDGNKSVVTDAAGSLVRVNGELTMNGGATLQNNITSGDSGGVYVATESTFTMTGGTISGNTASGGGAVYVTGSGIFTMNSGTISDNKATHATTGGGVHFANGTVNLGGTAVISGNTKSGATSNVYLPNNKYIMLGTGDNAPAEGMEVWVTKTANSGVIVESATATDVQYFHPDDDSKVVAFDGTSIKIASTYTVSFNATAAGAASGATVSATYNDTAIANGATVVEGGTLVLTATGNGASAYNYTWSGTGITDSGTNTVTVSGLAANIDATCTVTGKNNLTVSDILCDLTATTYNGTAQGLTATATGGGAVTLYYGGSTTAPTNAGTYAITADVAESDSYNAATGLSLGDYTIDKATPTITFDAITEAIAGNTVALTASSDSDGTGGEITYSSGNAAIAAVDGNSVTFLKAGTVEITASQAESANYEAATEAQYVTVTLPATVTTFAQLKAAVLSYADAAENMTITVGANITMTELLSVPANSGRTLTITSDGTTRTITRGSGVTGKLFNIPASASLILEDITLDGNKTVVTSAGSSLVYVDGGTLTMNDGTTLQNNATNGTGGGVYLNTGSSTFIMNGGIITGNSTNIGGGVALMSGTFTMTGGQISGNSCSLSYYGGGVHVQGGTFKLGGSAVISGNSKGTAANNVYFNATSWKITFLDGDDAPTTGMEIGVTHSSSTSPITITATNTNAASYAGYFSSDVDTKYISVGTNVLQLRDRNNISEATVTHSALTYNGTAQTPASFTVMDGETTLTADTDYTLSAVTPQTNAGTVNAATITGIGKYTGTADVSVTIGQRDLDNVTIEEIEALIYTGTEQEPTPSVSDGDITISTGDYTVSYSDNKDVGDATVTLTGTGNYTGEISETFAITQKDLTITAADYGVVKYNDPIPEQSVYSVIYEGFVGGENESVLGGSLSYATNYTQGSPVSGSYYITPSGLTSDNYYITFANGVLTVGQGNQADLVITGKPEGAITYGDSGFTLDTDDSGSGTGAVTYEVTSGTAVSVDENTGAVTIIGAGNATITATKAEDDNYVAKSATVDITVAKAVLTVTADNKTVPYGQTPTFTVTYGGFVNGEGATNLGGTLDFDCNYTTTSPVGTYEIWPKDLTSDNYDIIFAEGTLTVNKAEQATLTITGGDITKTYDPLGAFALSTSGGSSTSYMLSFTVETGTDVISIVGYTVTMKKAGTATVTVTKPGDDNYEPITSAPITITVNKAEQGALTIDGGNIEKTYGDIAFTLSTSGGDGDGVVTYELTDGDAVSLNESTGLVTILKAGTAEVTATKAGDDKYNAATSDAITVTVDQRQISDANIEVTGEYTYTGAAQTPTSLSVSDDSIAITSSDYEITGYSDNMNAGVNTAKIEIGGLGNYTGTKTVNFTIKKAPLTVSADGKIPGITYGDAAPSLSSYGESNVTITGLQGEDDFAALGPLSFTYDGQEYVKNSPAQKYYIVPGGFTNSNYEYEYEQGNLQVAERNLSNVQIAAIPDVIYSGTEQEPEPDVSESDTSILLSEDDYTVSYLENKDAGTATVKLIGKGNYEGEITEDFSINKATLSVKADNKTIPFASDAPEYTYTFTGFKGNDNKNNAGITGTAQLSCASYKKGYSKGLYGISLDNISGLSANNYEFTLLKDPSNPENQYYSNGWLDVQTTSGAAVSAAPIVASKTTESITLSAVANAAESEQSSLIDNDAGITREDCVQNVEYALNTSTALPTTGWQESTTFAELEHSTTYYAFARTTSNDNYYAGVAQMSAAINTDGKYTVSLTVNKDGAAYASHGKTFYLKQGANSYTGTGSGGTVTFAQITEGVTYSVYDGDTNTGVTIAVSSDNTSVVLNYYTVQFAVTNSGAASGSTIKATYDGAEITSGTIVQGGKTLVLTASGKGASTYSYSWSIGGESSGATASITIENLAKAINATCTVSGTAASSSRESSSSREESSSQAESSVAESSSQAESSVAESSASSSEAEQPASSVSEASSTAESSSEAAAESSATESAAESSAAAAESAAEAARTAESDSERDNSRDSDSDRSRSDSDSDRETKKEPETIAEAIQEVREKAAEVITEMFSGARTPVGPKMDLSLDVDIGSAVYGRGIMLNAKGLKPFTEIKVTVYSEPQVLGVQTADEYGEAALWAVFPEDLEEGIHTVIAEGIGTLDEPIQSVSMVEIDGKGILLQMMEASQVMEPIDPGDKSLVRAMEAGKPIYDPARNPGTVAGATLAICVTGGGLAAMAGLSKPGKHSRNREERRSNDGEGLGDGGFLWKLLPFRAASDNFSIGIQEATSRISFTLHRFVSDGVWSRAMFGSGGFLLWLLGAGMGYYASMQVGFKALPPEFNIVLAIVALGFLDAGAGFMAWLMIALCAVCTGHVSGINDVCTLLGMFTLFAALMTLSGSRPLRREYKHSKKFIFDRIMDYIIPTVYLMIASSAVLNVINGLSGLELFSEENGRTIKLVSVVALWVRLILEDIAINLFPRRYSQVYADAEIKQSFPLVLGAIALYISMFVIVSIPFFGFGMMLMFLLALDVIPSLLTYAEDYLPNSKFLSKWYPGADSTYASFVLTVIGIFLTLQLMTGTTDYRNMSVAMVILAIPTAVAEIPSLFGRDEIIQRGWFRRVAEVGCWALFALISLDIIKLV